MAKIATILAVIWVVVPTVESFQMPARGIRMATGGFDEHIAERLQQKLEMGWKVQMEGNQLLPAWSDLRKIVPPEFANALVDFAKATNYAETSKGMQELSDAMGQALRKVSTEVAEIYHSIELSSTVTKTEILIAAVVAIFVSTRALGVFEEDVELPTSYDIERIDKYYRKRPMLTANRLFQVASRLGSFYLRFYSDRIFGKRSEQEERKLAVELRELLSELGPAFIKVGQAVSIRPDLMASIYIEELQKLQDKVPPFGAREARKLIEEELRQPIDVIFENREDFELPIAAASLGQVYKAKMKDGTQVAVKVQRPDMLTSVTLDLHVIRILLFSLAKIDTLRESALSIVGVVDNWAQRFIEELDYVQEAQNAEKFAEQMSQSEVMRDAIVVPSVYKQLTTRYVMVSEWIDGDKLASIDTSTELGRNRFMNIVKILLNAYLVQLLETGFLHADPHPGSIQVLPDSVKVPNRIMIGNFLCTKDGKLCILDFGLMTEVSEEKRFALLEYVSHLTARDFESTLNDLIILGFIPEEIGAEADKRKIVVPLLASVLGQLADGGGAKGVNVEVVGKEVEELAKQYPIVVPDYFGLIVRAFSSLEGLGLQVDPKYSIVNDCFPYLARRLLADDSPRMKTMLRRYLYGSSNKLSVERIDEIVNGYRSFTTMAKSAAAVKEATGLMISDAEMGGLGKNVDAPTVEALKLLFSRDGNYLQDLIVEEAVRMVDALGREAGIEIVRFLRAVTDIPYRVTSIPFGEMSRSFAQFNIPYLIASRSLARLEEILRLDENDVDSLKTIRRILYLIRGDRLSEKNDPPEEISETGRIVLSDLILYMINQNGLTSLMTPFQVVELTREVSPILPVILPGVQNMSTQFVQKLTRRILSRLTGALDP